MPAGGFSGAAVEFLFLSALAIQIAMLAFRLETGAEAKVILVFHVIGTVMELFKTSAGSWYLLMILSFVLVTLVRRPQPIEAEESERTSYSR